MQRQRHICSQNEIDFLYNYASIEAVAENLMIERLIFYFFKPDQSGLKLAIKARTREVLLILRNMIHKRRRSYRSLIKQNLLSKEFVVLLNGIERDTFNFLRNRWEDPTFFIKHPWDAYYL